MILRGVVLLLVIVLSGRLYQLQLVDNEARRYGGETEVITLRPITVAPRRGEIFARDGKTLLAESKPIYTIAILPDSLPSRGSERRAQVLGELAQLAMMNSTIAISPSIALQHNPQLHNDLEALGIDNELYPGASDTATVTLQAAQTMPALALTQTYSDVLTFNNPIEELILESNVPRYQTISIKPDVSHALALAVRENSTHMPGVMVVEGYRRHYPQSAHVSSLSHLLGHIGHISQCELASENPTFSWLNSLLNTVSDAASCGLIARQIETGPLGVSIYQHDDSIGKDGLEASYETELRGSLGIENIGVDALERQVIPARTLQPVQNGNNLILTIDLDFQHQTETILRRWLDESEARRKAAKDHRNDYPPITSGVAVALDPRNGQVLAMVSVPNFDNNIWVDPAREAELMNLLAPKDPQAREELERLTPLYNRAIAGLYPAGSTLKQFVGAIALQKGVIQADTRLRDPGVLVLTQSDGAQFVLPNSVRRNNGPITVSDALKVSSNVFFASIAGGNNEVDNLGPSDFRTNGLQIEQLAEGLEWFGLGRPTGIRLAGEGSGLVPTPTWKAYRLREPWTTGDTYNMAIGQGYLTVTPLQLVTAASAIADDGTIYRPQIVERITDSSGHTVQGFTSEVTHQVDIEPAHLQTIREGMRRSVTEGANVAARDDCSGLSIAGKTGTAEFGNVFYTSDGKQSRRSHSWFVGFAPYDDPQIAVVVLLEGTGDLNDGSATLAAPAVTQIMQAYFQITPPADTLRGCPVLPR
ncbi:MAG: peptidoglycan glycosyltransferase [Chloroflexales bacterium]|nr:peptidoglycan glycosyltransferase [Chloroflexales bacterium]